MATYRLTVKIYTLHALNNHFYWVEPRHYHFKYNVTLLFQVSELQPKPRAHMNWLANFLH